MQSKSLTIVLSVALVLAGSASIFLGFKWQHTENDINSGVQAITNLEQTNQDLNLNISNTETDLASLKEQIQSLELEIGQLTDNRNALQDKEDLYQSQNNYLTDMLNWYNQNYFFQEAGGLINTYADATGNAEP